MIVFTLVACSTHPAAIRTGPPLPTIAVALPAGAPGELRLTRVAHASVLIEAGGERILTDPWFTESAAYHPGEPLGFAPDTLGQLTGVVVSHAHYDHFDVDALADIVDAGTPLVVKRGDGRVAEKAGFTQFTELDAWESAELGSVRVTAAPAAHGVPENSYILEIGGFVVFFGGDSKLLPEHREVAERFPHVDLVLAPVNGLSAMGHQEVMNAEEAGELVSWLSPTVAVPIHYRFRGSGFTDRFILGYDGDPERFVAASSKQAPHTRVVILETGQPLVLTR